jgi:hypothetical protein
VTTTFDLTHQNENLNITIEPAIYQDKRLYEVAMDGRFYTFFEREGSWQHDEELPLDNDLKTKIIELIDELDRSQTQSSK